MIFQSKTSFDVNDQRENGKEPIVGTVKIRLKTGPQAIKCFMGYGWCSLNKGFVIKRTTAVVRMAYNVYIRILNGVYYCSSVFFF